MKLLVAALGVLFAVAQTPTYRAPHRADGHPDVSGIWQAFVTANWDLQDHEAQPGLHPELDGAYSAGRWTSATTRSGTRSAIPS
jgi:hypothetical protein